MQRAALLGVRWWSRVAARSLRELGESALQREQFEEAARLFGQALRELDAQHQQKEQQQQQQQQQQEADEEEEEERLQLLNRQGFALASQGALEPARAVLTRCRDVAARRGDARALATAQINLAAVLLQQGQGEEALALLREARAAREQHAGLAAPETLDALADETRALLALGRPDEAWPLAQEAAQRLPSCPGDAEQLRHLTLLVWSLLVELASRLKRPVSEDGVQQLLALADGNEQTLQLVATYYASQNRSQDTIAVLKLLPESEDVLTQMGMLHMSANENEAAQEVLTRALRLLEKEHGVQSLYLAKTLWLLGLALQGAKRPHDAQRHLLRLMALVKKENNAEFEARVSRQLAIVSAQQGLPNQHLYYLKYALRLAEPFPELKSALEQELAITLKKH